MPSLEVLSCVSIFPLRFLFTIMNLTQHTRALEIGSMTRMNGAGLTGISKQSVFSIHFHRAGFG